jgi:hypothetical protein
MSRQRFQTPKPFREAKSWYIWVREDVFHADGSLKRKTKKRKLGPAEWTEKQAQRAAAGILRTLNSTNYRPRTAQNFAEFAEDWMNTCLKEPHYSPSEIPPYRSNLRRHLIPVLGEVNLAEVGPEHIDKLITVLAAGREDESGNQIAPVGSKTINNLIGCLAAIHKKAVAWGKISKEADWFDGVKKPEYEKGQGRVFTREQGRSYS